MDLLETWCLPDTDGHDMVVAGFQTPPFILSAGGLLRRARIPPASQNRQQPAIIRGYIHRRDVQYPLTRSTTLSIVPDPVR